MKFVLIAAAAMLAAAITTTAPAFAAFIVTEGSVGVVPASQTVVCDGSQAMCAPFLTGDFTYVTSPVSVLTGVGEEARFGIGEKLQSFSVDIFNNEAASYFRIIDGDGLEIAIFGDVFTAGATRINFAFDPGDERIIDSVVFGNFNGSSQWSNFAVDVVDPVVGGVPEPSSWAMMIVGFGLVGSGMRQSRRVVAA